MNGWRIRRLVSLLFGMLVLFSLAISTSGSASAQSGKTLHWERYDVTIDIHQDGTFHVTEDQAISFDSGYFSQGYAVIPLGRVEEISNVQLSADGQPYTRTSTTGDPGTFTASQFGGDLNINWWFDPAIGPETRNFTLSYDVAGGLRVYDDRNINQIWWRAIDEDFAADISHSTITINLPGDVAFEDLAADVFTHDYNAENIEISQPDGDTVLYRLSDIDQGDAIEPRVTFPQMTTAVAPDWQEADDARREREERLEPYRALANVIFLGAGVLLAIGGPVGLYGIWHSYGRDNPVEIPIDILREPPEDLSPGAVGTLIDEQADIHDLVATLVDLAERDIIHISEDNSEILGITTSRDWKITKIGSFDGLKPPEKALALALFGTKDIVNLKSARQSFGKQQGKVRKAFYKELVDHGYFSRNPESVRNWWRIGGVVLLGTSAVIGFMLWSAVGSFAPFVLAVLIGLGILGVAVMIASRYMPRKTPKGAQAAARWVAFRRYLEQIEQYGDLQEARDIFARYLPYAIAFGIEKSWVRKFSQVDTPAPHWYGPRRYGRGWPRHGGPIVTGGGSGGGMPDMPSLDDVSGSFAGSLQGMSDGLFNMFNQASSSFRPYSSSSSSGSRGSFGGFSGGGGSFGGGGGGGGRGFS
ncbi:MAG: DUF2207 domain-containing protein [Thermomicrobiales bacterium]